MYTSYIHKVVSSLNWPTNQSIWHLVLSNAAKKYWIILRMRICFLKPAISIEFNDVDSNNSAGYEECTCILYMIQNTCMKKFHRSKGKWPLDVMKNVDLFGWIYV